MNSPPALFTGVRGPGSIPIAARFLVTVHLPEWGDNGADPDLDFRTSLYRNWERVIDYPLSAEHNRATVLIEEFRPLRLSAHSGCTDSALAAARVCVKKS